MRNKQPAVTAIEHTAEIQVTRSEQIILSLIGLIVACSLLTAASMQKNSCEVVFIEATPATLDFSPPQQIGR